MAKNQVEVIITARDLVSQRFNLLKNATLAYEKTLNRLNGTAQSVAGTLMRYGAPAGGLFGFKQAIQEGFAFNSMLEDTRLAITSLLATTQSYRDGLGRVLKGEDAWTAAQAQAGGIQEQLQIANLKTAATLDQISRAYQQSLVPATKAAFDPAQVVKYSSALVQAATAMNVPLHNLAEESRAILTGNMQDRITLLKPLMEAAGITNARIKELIDSGKLYNEVMAAFAQTSKGAEQAANNFSTRLSNLKDAFSLAMGTGLEDTFESVKALLADVQRSLVSVNEEAGRIRVNEGFLQQMSRIDALVSGAVNSVRNLSAAIANFTSAHPILSEITGDVLAFSLGVIASATAIRGMASTVTFLKAFAAANLAYVGTLFSGIALQISEMAAAAVAAGGPVAWLAAAIAGIIVTVAGFTLYDWIKEWEIAGLKVEEYVEIASLKLDNFLLYLWELGNVDLAKLWSDAWDKFVELAVNAFNRVTEAIARAATNWIPDLYFFGGEGVAGGAGQVPVPGPSGPTTTAAILADIERQRAENNARLNAIFTQQSYNRTGHWPGYSPAAEEGLNKVSQAATNLGASLQGAGTQAEGFGGRASGAARKALDSFSRLESEARQLIETLRTPAEIYAEETSKYQAFLDAKLISTGQFNLALEKLQKEQFKAISVDELLSIQAQQAAKYQEDFFGTLVGGDVGIRTGGTFNAIASAAQEARNELKKTTDEMSQFAIQAARNVQSALGDGIYNYLTRRYDDIGAAFGDMLARMASDILSSYLAKWLFGSFATTGEMGGLFGFIGSKIFHQGGVVGRDAAGSKMVNPAVFAFAPRLHSGLAADEFPAILQRGEEVISKRDAGKARGVPIATNINVNLPAGAMGGATDAASAKALGNLIGQSVKAEFNRYLTEQLRPGGILNRGI